MVIGMLFNRQIELLLLLLIAKKINRNNIPYALLHHTYEERTLILNN